MAGIQFTTRSVPVGDKSFNGGLNSTGSPLSLNNNESPDLQNVDFDKFGSILKRNGYTALNTSAITNSPNSDGLHWFEYVSGGNSTYKLINVADGKLWKMDDLDGTWDDITGGLTITADSFCDFENFLNEVYITNGTDAPFKWDGSTAATMTVPSGLTKAKYVRQFNNYLFLANVVVSGTTHQSRIYWSDLKDTGTWGASNFIEIAKDDGQQITGIKVLSDRLVIFKTRSIYTLFFTGDPDIPFTLPGGGKSNSSVGCVAPFSIQEVENGLVFLSNDGLYYFDGSNSFKISDKITTTLLGYNTTIFNTAVSVHQKNKNRYLLAISSSGQTNHDRVVVWDYFNNAFSIYTGMAIAACTAVYVSGIEERIYWGDYSGFIYRGDTGSDDYPLNVQTAIDAYYYTNWRSYEDLVNQKAVPHVYIYYQTNNSILTFSYSYNFNNGDEYSQTFNMSAGSSLYGSAIYDTDTYAESGGAVERRDLTGRGRVVRFKFSNNILTETFQIDGVGTLPHLETYV